MSQVIRYRGGSDRRTITASQWLSVGITAPDAVWEKSNGFELILDDIAAAYALSQGEFEAGDPNVKFGHILSKPHVWVAPGYGQQWDTVKSLAGAGLYHVHVWGDSISSNGSGITPTDSVSRRTLGMTGLIETAVQAKYGDGGSGYLSQEYCTSTGTWTGRMGFGGSEVIASAAASRQWTAIRGTTLRLYFRNVNTPTGAFRWRVDGGAWLPVAPPVDTLPPLGITSVEPGWQEVTGLADVPHTVDVEWVSGTIAICGLYAQRATGVVFDRIGASGRAAIHYGLGSLGRIIVGTTNASATVTSAAHGVFNSSMVGRYLFGTGFLADAKINSVAADGSSAVMDRNCNATGTATVDLVHQLTYGLQVPQLVVEPAFSTGLTRAHLVILCLGANDVANSDATARDFRDGMSRIMKTYTMGSAINYSPDFIVMTEHQGDWFDTYFRYPEVAAQQRALAQAMGGAHIDVWGKGHRSHQYWSEEPHNFFNDTIHPNNAGHVAYAEDVIDLVCR